MNIQFHKNILWLIVLSFIISNVNLRAENQVVNPYKVPFTTQNDRWIRFYSEQDLLLLFRHIDFLAENSSDIVFSEALEDCKKIKEHLEANKSAWFDSGQYKALELHIALVAVHIDNNAYLMPFAADLYGVRLKNGIEMHIK